MFAICCRIPIRPLFAVRTSYYSTAVAVDLEYILNKPWREKERARLTMGERILDCFEASNLVWSLIVPPTSSDRNSDATTFFQRQNPVDEVRLLELYDLLEAEKLSPIIGGSLAAMVYSVGRVTNEVDINLVADRTKFETLRQLVQKNPNFTDVTPLFDSTAGKKMVPVCHTHFKYKGLPIGIYFNSNFATQYAVENAVTVKVKDNSLKFIPPESVCGFKMANSKEKSLRFFKDQNDVAIILKMATVSDLQKINKYVEQAIDIVQGPNSAQLVTWRNLMTSVMEIRTNDFSDE